MNHQANQHPSRRRIRRVMLLIATIIGCVAGWLVLNQPRPVFPAMPGAYAIAYEQSVDGGSPQIYLMRTDGTNPTQLTSDVQWAGIWWRLPFPLPHSSVVMNQLPMPSPTGQGVTFLSTYSGPFMFHHINLDGSQQTLLPTPTKGNLNAALAPDGQRIAFQTQAGALAVITTDGAHEQCLTCQLTKSTRDYAWSPDGQQIAFSMDTESGPDLFVIRADGTHLARLSTTPDGFSVNPSWSPDGQSIAFRSSPDGGVSAIYVMRADGTQQVRLPQTEMGQAPSWSPDGQQIVFASSRSGNAQIFVIQADGSVLTQLTSGPGNKGHPVWVH